MTNNKNENLWTILWTICEFVNYIPNIVLRRGVDYSYVFYLLPKSIIHCSNWKFDEFEISESFINPSFVYIHNVITK